MYTVAIADIMYCIVTARNASRALEETRHAVSNAQTKPSALLSAADPDSWVGRRVHVTTGRHLGHTGLVRSSGNGWVQIETCFGEVAKRAYELELLDDSIGDVGATVTVRKRARHDEHECKEKEKRVEDTFPSHCTIPYEALHLDEDLGGGLRHPSFREARRLFVTKYVHKNRQKLGSRPDLRAWKSLLNGSLFRDQVVELQAARIFEDVHCAVCLLERWPGAKFCWNENCAASPVYYKLTGQTPSVVSAASEQDFYKAEKRSNTVASFLLNAPKRRLELPGAKQDQLGTVVHGLPSGMGTGMPLHAWRHMASNLQPVAAAVSAASLMPSSKGEEVMRNESFGTLTDCEERSPQLAPWGFKSMAEEAEEDMMPPLML
jgi:hypothetical protein